MKINFLIIIIYTACIANCIADKINDNNIYSFDFIFSAIIKDIPEVKNITANQEDFRNFSFIVSKLDIDKNAHRLYDNALSIKISENKNIIFHVYFVEDIAMKIEKIILPSLEKINYERNIPSINNTANYPEKYLYASNFAYKQLIKYGDLLFYLKIGKNKIGLKKAIINKNSYVILIKYYDYDYLQNLSISNEKLYNIAIGKEPTEKSPWGKLFFSVTMMQQKIIAGTIKMDDKCLDYSFFSEGGLERYMTGENDNWSNVTIWNKKGEITKQLSYNDWAKMINK